jgi:hypothetical protein
VIAPGATYFGALEEAEPYSLTFQTVDTQKVAGGTNTRNGMRVRYCLNDAGPTNEVLWEQIKRFETAAAPTLPTATACPDLSASDWDTSTQLVQHVTNRIGGQKERPVFTYSGVGVPQIIAVESSLRIDLKPGSRPGATVLTGGVSLRNANRQPIVEFTATVAGDKQVTLNASASRDPDGLALTYKWWQDGVLLPTAAQRYTTPQPLSPGTHHFKLEVKNPGGLTNTTEQPVTVTA